MGDVTGEVMEARAPRRIPFAGLALLALVVAGVLVGGLLLLTGGGGQKSGRQLASGARTVDGEVNLTALSAEQLKPLSARVDASSVRLHPQLVKVAGVGTDGFTDTSDQASS